MEDDQQFCLRWNNHQSTLISVFDTLLENGTLVDCTLAAEGKFLKAHKVVLSACSPYFATLLTQQYDKHPVFILKDVKFQELRAMMDYMYRGEVNISQDQLAALLRAAESLQIKGLSDNRGGGGGGGGSSSSGGDSGSKSENAQKPIPVPVVSKPGLTIEQKRPNKHPAIDADLCESREGSTSPTSRKRKKIRRRSTETNNLVDNHDQLSNSSSQSMPHHHQQQQQQQQTKHMTSSVAPLPQITSATSAANVLNVTKKTDIHEPKKELDQSMQQEVADDDDDDDDQNEVQEQPVRRMKTQHHDIDMSHLKEKMESTHSELLIEPKSEYDDGNDETVEDLTLDEEELLEDLDQAGPSHGGEGSSQGYAQWQVDRSQDEVFLAAQEAAGQHRDAQEKVDETSKMSESKSKILAEFTNIKKSTVALKRIDCSNTSIEQFFKDKSQDKHTPLTMDMKDNISVATNSADTNIFGSSLFPVIKPICASKKNPVPPLMFFKPIMCKCRKVFESFTSLRSHFRNSAECNTHIQVKCMWCARVFLSKRQTSFHMKHLKCIDRLARKPNINMNPFTKRDMPLTKNNVAQPKSKEISADERLKIVQITSGESIITGNVNVNTGSIVSTSVSQLQDKIPLDKKIISIVKLSDIEKNQTITNTPITDSNKALVASKEPEENYQLNQNAAEENSISVFPINRTIMDQNVTEISELSGNDFLIPDNVMTTLRSQLHEYNRSFQTNKQSDSTNRRNTIARMIAVENLERKPENNKMKMTKLICQCNKTFRSIVPLKLHCKESKKCQDYNIKCTCCNTVFRKMASLITHFKSKDTIKTCLDDDNKPKCTKKAMGPQVHSTTITESQPIVNIDVITEIETELSIDQFSNLLDPLKDDFPVNRTEETNELEFVCKICQRKFFKQMSYDKHTYCCWNRLQDFTCACGLQFIKAEEFMEHLNNEDCGTNDLMNLTNEMKLYLCQCTNQFSSGSDAKVHVKEYLGYSPQLSHKCTFCRKCFLTAENLSNHERFKSSLELCPILFGKSMLILIEPDEEMQQINSVDANRESFKVTIDDIWKMQVPCCSTPIITSVIFKYQQFLCLCGEKIKGATTFKEHLIQCMEKNNVNQLNNLEQKPLDMFITSTMLQSNAKPLKYGKISCAICHKSFSSLVQLFFHRKYDDCSVGRKKTIDLKTKQAKPMEIINKIQSKHDSQNVIEDGKEIIDIVNVEIQQNAEPKAGTSKELLFDWTIKTEPECVIEDEDSDSNDEGLLQIDESELSKS